MKAIQREDGKVIKAMLAERGEVDTASEADFVRFVMRIDPTRVETYRLVAKMCEGVEFVTEGGLLRAVEEHFATRFFQAAKAMTLPRTIVREPYSKCGKTHIRMFVG